MFLNKCSPCLPVPHITLHLYKITQYITAGINIKNTETNFRRNLTTRVDTHNLNIPKMFELAEVFL